MINVSKIFYSTMPISTRLPFGVLKNVKLKEIYNGERFDGKGQVREKNCYIRFVQYNDKNEPIAEDEFGYFNLTKEKYAKANFTRQFLQLISIVETCMPAKESDRLVAELETYVNENIEGFEKVWNGEIKEEDLDEIQKTISKFSDKVVEVVSPYINSSEYVQLMVACSTNGRYTDLPNEESGFIAANDAKRIEMPARYKLNRSKKDIPETDFPDIIEEDAPMVSSDDITADDDDNLEDM